MQEKSNQEQTKNEPRTHQELSDPARVDFTPSCTNSNSELYFSNDKLSELNIKKNTTAKLTLTIRRHQESFLYEQMKGLDYEARLNLLTEHLTSLQEMTYEARERQLATAKIKEHELLEIEKLNKIDINEYRKTGEILESKEQKRETSRFEKDAIKFKKLNMGNEQIINILKSLGCNPSKANEIVEGL